MKHYDYICRNYGIVINPNVINGCLYGHIDYIGNNPNRKRQGNGFIVYNTGMIAFDFPEAIPTYLYKTLQEIFS